MPWSDTRTALGLRVDGAPLLYSDDRLYLQVGHAALKTLAGSLEGWALQEFTALVRSLPNIDPTSV